MTESPEDQPNWLDRLRRIHGDRPSLDYAVAEKLFAAHNRSKGAAFPGGLGFMSKTDQVPWILRAQRLLSARVPA